MFLPRQQYVETRVTRLRKGFAGSSTSIPNNRTWGQARATLLSILPLPRCYRSRATK